MEEPSFDNEQLKRIQERLKKGYLTKALKGFKKSGIPFNQIESDLILATDIAFRQKNIGEILSAYYQFGQYSKYSVIELLRSLYQKENYPTFLKQVYRFGAFSDFENEVESSILWHENKHLPDAFAWRLKFEKIKENLRIGYYSYVKKVEDNTFSIESVKIIDEELSEKKGEFVFLDLKPINRSKSKNVEKSLVEIEEQPYVLSQVSKKKLENANRKHSFTLSILKDKLRSIGCEVTETKHIDAFAVVNKIPAIFEVKSINEDNENDQVRAAISQLYEYRFLYSLFDASLWVVFSEKPFSSWILDYLSQDRNINVLWIENDSISGLSKGLLV
jgi:hypothetical protein